MKRAYITIFRNLHERNIICKMLCNVFLCPFNSNQVILFQAHIDAVIGLIIGNIPKHFPDHFYHQIINIQFAARPGKYEFYCLKMQELCFGGRFNKRRMPVVVAKEGQAAIMLQ